MNSQDKAYQLMTLKADAMELKYGERTNVETLYEGKTKFIYDVYFCDDNNIVTVKKITISIKGYSYN